MLSYGSDYNHNILIRGRAPKGMTFGKFKSKKRALHVRKTATGSRIVHTAKKTKGLHCASCGCAIIGTASSRSIPKTQKSVSRPFGGVKCASCVREMMKIKARSL